MSDRPSWPDFTVDEYGAETEWRGFKVKFCPDYIGINIAIYRSGEQICFRHASDLKSARWMAEGFIRDRTIHLDADPSICSGCGETILGGHKRYCRPCAGA